jgi:transposase
VGRNPTFSADQKLNAVMTVMRGEMSQVELGRRMEISQTTISKWLKQFTEGGREALARGDNARAPSTKREDELQAQVEELTSALGEAYVELRVWRKGGALYPGSRTSR